MKQLTASGCGISIPDPLADTPVHGCQYWRRSDIEWDKTPAGERAELGTALHDCAESFSLGEPVDLDQYKDKPWYNSLRRRYSNWLEWWKHLPLTAAAKAHVEVPLRLNVKTGDSSIIIGQRTRRDYSMCDPSKEIGGTADLIVHCPTWETDLWVYDYKTGDQPVPASSTQMVVLGLMAAKVFEAKRVNLVVVTVHEDGVWEQVYELTPKILVALRNIQQAFFDSTETPNAGPWCRWCPARQVCPAVSAALETLPAKSLTHKLSTSVSSPEHASWLATNVGLAEEFLARVKDALKAYADNNGGVLLEDGSVWAGKDQHENAPSLTNDACVYLRKIPNGDKVMRRFTSWAIMEEYLGKEQTAIVRADFVKNGWINQKTKRVYRSRKGK